jgi:protein-tyrosine phosphatase
MESESYTILFVCSGNSCRTPIAEGLLKTKLPDALKDQVKVISAGTLGLPGNPATYYAIQAAGELGANIAEHRSQGISEQLMREADIVFCMARGHKDILASQFSQFSENVFLLRAFDRQPSEQFYLDVEDPIGRDLPEYRACAQLINSELERILPRLKGLIEGKLNR